MSYVVTKFTRPFYDGLGKPLVGAIITLRNESGSHIFNTFQELSGNGMSGIYTTNITEKRQYWIWVQPNSLSQSKCIGSVSPKLKLIGEGVQYDYFDDIDEVLDDGLL